MPNLDATIEQIHQSYNTRTKVRDQMLNQARMLTRHCANAIRAIHREDRALAQEHLNEAQELANALSANSTNHPNFFYAGYTQDALKEYAEANLTNALVTGETIPTPNDLDLDFVPYLKGLAETAGELRRRCMHVLRHGDEAEADRLLAHMDDIYDALVTMDYSDAITGGLRRLTDIVRGVTERTRGDLTMSLRQQRLEKQLKAFEEQVSEFSKNDD
ncbi:MAG: haloacid dehalogenase [Anaerolineales bacterium]|nr:haloacid dehalogenase [Chloroflexota bacterium]MBL6981190.1 haloacid dehalogenase [Anaerolineales bacterium]